MWHAGGVDRLWRFLRGSRSGERYCTSRVCSRGDYDRTAASALSMPLIELMLIVNSAPSVFQNLTTADPLLAARDSRIVASSIVISASQRCGLQSWKLIWCGLPLPIVS